MPVCPRCGNDDFSLFGKKKGQYYCRRCLSLPVDNVEYVVRNNHQGELTLDYSLTSEQLLLSKKLINFYEKKENCLIHATCGAGKTEIVYPLIERALKDNKRVGFAIPRKDVVIDLFPRIEKAFSKNVVVAIYGGHHEQVVGDITILTMHQISRFEHYFDVLIADEIDAFPFHNNALLEHFFFRSSRGMIVMMSATPSTRWLNYFPKHNILKLEKRFHGFPIPIPEIIVYSGIMRFIYVLKTLRSFIQEKKPCLIFVDTIEKSEVIAYILKFFYKNGTYVHSKREDRVRVISDFKKRKYDYLVTTSILERGVTIPSLQVIVYDANKDIYNAEVLEQISGRVGRKKEDPYGKVIFLGEKKTRAMEKAQHAIIAHNATL